ncbi:hypothetical protein DSECCO2_378280 [anaerobic digester metagenome]
MTPVEQTNTSSSPRPSSFSASVSTSFASRMPCSPVAALAFPLLMTIARAFPFFKISRSRITGAAQNLLVVKQAAQEAGNSEYRTATSGFSFLRLLMPA